MSFLDHLKDLLEGQQHEDTDDGKPVGSLCSDIMAAIGEWHDATEAVDPARDALYQAITALREALERFEQGNEVHYLQFLGCPNYDGSRRTMAGDLEKVEYDPFELVIRTLTDAAHPRPETDSVWVDEQTTVQISTQLLEGEIVWVDEAGLSDLLQDVVSAQAAYNAARAAVPTTRTAAMAAVRTLATKHVLIQNFVDPQQYTHHYLPPGKYFGELISVGDVPDWDRGFVIELQLEDQGETSLIRVMTGKEVLMYEGYAIG